MSAAALAQDEEASGGDDRIVVTGSRIQRQGFESLQPSTVIDSTRLEQRGLANVADALNELPYFGVPVAPVGGQGGTNNGQNQLNFLNLGPQRTLTLVNSRRFVSSNSVSNLGSPGLQVDLNTIPVALIDRVETIAVGGAPIYGTDAIAGTVNIILKDDFEGVDFTVQGGLSPDEGDAARHRVSMVAGSNFDNDRGNVTFAVDYASQNGLRWSDRPNTAGRGFHFEAVDPTSPFTFQLIENATVAATDFDGIPVFSNAPGFFAAAGNGFPVDPANPAGPIYQFDGGGGLVPWVAGEGPGLFRQGGDGLDLYNRRALANDLDRISANLQARYDITDNVRARVEGWFARTNTTELVDEPFFQSVTFAPATPQTLTDFGQGAAPVLFSNPFINNDARAILSDRLDFDRDGSPDMTVDTDGDGVPDAAGFYVDRGFASVAGAAPESATQQLYRTVVGFEGEAGFGGREFNWEVFYTYGEARSEAETLEVVRDRFAQAVNVIADPTTGQPVCVDPSNGCAPLNVMVANPDQAAIDFVLGVNDPLSVNRQHLVTANIGGPVYDLPAGEVQAVVGFDYRFENARFDPGGLDALGLFDEQSAPISGSFNTKEVYGEALIPVFGRDFAPIPVDALEIEGALRYVDNSLTGGDLTWTAGGRFRPIPDIEFRGNVTRSIRSPAVTELFLSETPVLSAAIDPCDEFFINAGNFPDVRAANCAADGITQPFASLITRATAFGTASGNPELQNETAKSWTVGVILRPRFIEGLTLSSDWISINVEDAIENLDIGTILAGCYDSADFPNEASCNNFTRNADGQIVDFQQGFVNIGLIEFQGLATNMIYGFDTDRAGRFDFSVNALYTDELTRTVGAGNPVPLAGQIGNSRHQVTGSANWRKGKFSLGSQVRWLSGAAFDNTDTALTRDVARVPSWWVMNLNAGYDVSQNVALQVNVENLFNKDAPLGVPQTFSAAGLGAGLPTYYSGLLGRYITFTARVAF